MSVTAAQERFVALKTVAWLFLQAGIAAAAFYGYFVQSVSTFGIWSTTPVTAEALTLLEVSAPLLFFTATGTLGVSAIAVLLSPILDRDVRWVPRAGIVLTLIAFIVASILQGIAGEMNA